MSIDFGWVLIVAGLAGLLPSVRLALRRQRPTRTQWLRLIVHALLVLLGLLELERQHAWHSLRPPAATTTPVAATPDVALPLRNA